MRSAMLLAGVCLFACSSSALAVPRTFDAASERPATATDDTFWFGGTHWNAAEARWEANLGGTWTFDSGVGGPFEGWIHAASYATPLPTRPVGSPDPANFRWTHTALYALYGTQGTHLFPATTPPDTGAIWCGKYESEADELCWLAGQGYGINWLEEGRKTYSYGGTGDARLTFRYFVDSENMYDWTSLFLEFNGVREASPRWRSTGHIGIPVSPRTLTLTVNTASIPPGTTNISVVFRVTSDEGFSDEDHGYVTTFSSFCCYSFRYEDLGTPPNNEEDSFETNLDGWSFLVRPPSVDVVDVTPLSELPEPAIPCIDTVLQGNVLTFFDKNAGPGEPLHPEWQDVRALSPIIDLAAAGLQDYPTKLLVADYFADLPVANAIYVYPRLLVYPSPCVSTGIPEERLVPVSMWRWSMNAATPTCGDDVVLYDFSSEAENVQYCRVSLEVLNLCSYVTSCNGTGGNTTPWFDNIRLEVTNATVGVDPGAVPGSDILFTARPNPFSPSTILDYVVSSPANVLLRIFDVRGALLRTLVHERKQPGRYEAIWDGRDERGEPLPAGVFWARCSVGGREVSQKLVLLQ